MSYECIKLPFGAADLEIETGKIAKQAHGSIVAHAGETTVLVAVTHSPKPLEGRDFFPLMVDYREKFYAGGRIPGSFFRREARPGDAETLKARITDRCLRPIFPDGMRHEVMIYITVLSTDQDNQADILALNAASLALQISDIPFPTPIAGVRVAYIDGEYVLNPTYAQTEEADLAILMAGTSDALNMVEAGGNEVSEEVVLGALEFGHKAIAQLISETRDFVGKVAKDKFDPCIPQVPADLKAEIDKAGQSKFAELVRMGLSKEEYSDREHEIRHEIRDGYAESHPDLLSRISDYIEEVHADEVRKLGIDENRRVDGRGPEDIRDITCDIAVLRKAHGSGVFTRGQTQALGVVTLGTLDGAQKIDTMLGISDKRFLLHYNFPPWSVGEARPMRATNRREIGHGALAERAVTPTLPSFDDFPYTIRIVSEILESNGSSSMATVCVSSLAMMDAGVPVKKPVAGIAMGLVEREGGHAILTDIQGVEDHLGDMDFKVAGTRDGITALQMDIKVESIDFEVLSKALAQARRARMSILDSMAKTITEPREELSPNAPRLTTLHVAIDKIGMIIGPGGKHIRGLIERTGVNSIDVQDDGTVYIASNDGLAANACRDEILEMTAEAEIDKTYMGKVVRVTDFGAFIQILPGKDGMVHISELALGRVERVEDVLDVGDEIKVKVINIDDTGRVRLSVKAVLIDEGGVEEARGDRGGEDRGPRGGGGGGRGGDRGGDRGGGGGRGGDRGGRGGGDRGRGGDRGGRGGGDRGRSGGGRGRDEGGRESVGSLGFRERKREDKND